MGIPAQSLKNVNIWEYKVGINVNIANCVRL